MVEHIIPLCLTISWVYSVAMLVQRIVYEKEQRLKEVNILLYFDDNNLVQAYDHHNKSDSLNRLCDRANICVRELHTCIFRFLHIHKNEV